VADARTGPAVRRRRQPGTGESHDLLSDQMQDLTNAVQEFIMPKSSQRCTRLADYCSCPIPAEPTQCDTLRKKRGRWIAEAAREGCKRFWKTFVPQLPHQKSDPSAIENGVIVGLAGIQAALDEGNLDFAAIAPPDADLAVRYAVNDLAGFSPWLPALAGHKPESVRKVLYDCILGEWQSPADRKSGFTVMEDLASHGEGVAPLVQDSILELLKASDPPNCSILSAALLVLLKKAVDRRKEARYGDDSLGLPQVL